MKEGSHRSAQAGGWSWDVETAKRPKWSLGPRGLQIRSQWVPRSCRFHEAIFNHYYRKGNPQEQRPRILMFYFVIWSHLGERRKYAGTIEGEQSENENKCVSYTHVCAGIHLNPNLLLGCAVLHNHDCPASLWGGPSGEGPSSLGCCWNTEKR